LVFGDEAISLPKFIRNGIMFTPKIRIIMTFFSPDILTLICRGIRKNEIARNSAVMMPKNPIQPIRIEI
jgi:hypothetical protein